MAGSIVTRGYGATANGRIIARGYFILPPSVSAFDKIFDTGEIYQPLQNSVALVAGFLVETSFTLTEERRFILQRARTFVDLVGELYGETDGRFDFFIQTNQLSGDELVELPKGKEIVFYV